MRSSGPPAEDICCASELADLSKRSAISDKGEDGEREGRKKGGGLGGEKNEIVLLPGFGRGALKALVAGTSAIPKHVCLWAVFHEGKRRASRSQSKESL